MHPKTVGLAVWFLAATAGAAFADQAIILGGGGTEKEAAEWLAEVMRPSQRVDGALVKTFDFPEKYPRVVKSDDYPGLKPGLHVVVFGICETGLAKTWAKALKVADVSGVYTRQLAGENTSTCPRLDNLKMKNRLVLRRPTSEQGTELLLLRVLHVGSISVEDQVAALLVRAGALLDVWVPPADRDGYFCPATIDKLTGQVQTECAEHVKGDNCFDIYRRAFELTTASGAIKAKALKRKYLRRDCAE
jgi:hypothetical protein